MRTITSKNYHRPVRSQDGYYQLYRKLNSGQADPELVRRVKYVDLETGQVVFFEPNKEKSKALGNSIFSHAKVGAEQG